MHQIDLTVIYGIFHPDSKEYTLYSAIHGRFSKLEHILGHRTILYKWIIKMYYVYTAK